MSRSPISHSCLLATIIFRTSLIFVSSLQLNLCSVAEHLGSGQFGTVNKGVWQSPRGAVEAAIKTLKPGSDEMDQVKFLQEAAIMGQFKHPNVIKLYGMVTVGEPVSTVYVDDDLPAEFTLNSFFSSQTMIVLEFMPHGDLRDFLIKRRPMYASLRLN